MGILNGKRGCVPLFPIHNQFLSGWTTYIFWRLVFCLGNEAWTLLKIGLEGHVVGRTGEIIVEKITKGD